jgi:nucleoside-diphosphate-sugar epimerase
MEVIVGKVALWGAGGVIGHGVAQVLRDAGRPYRVVGRSRTALEQHFGSDALAEIVTWDPDDPASVRAAAEGIETIVYLVGVDYTKFELHPILMRKTLDGAIAAGVTNMLLVGTVYPYGRPQTTPVREDHPREPHTFKGRKRKEQEDLLLAEDCAGRIQGAVLRVPDFYGRDVAKSLINEIFGKGVAGKIASVIAPIDRPHEFAYVPDICPVIVRLLDEPRAYGKVWHLGGAGVTTTREMIARVERETGVKIKTFAVGKTALRLIGIVDPLLREFVEMHYLVTEPVILDDTALHELLGPIHKTSYDDGVRAIVG